MKNINIGFSLATQRTSSNHRGDLSACFQTQNCLLLCVLPSASDDSLSGQLSFNHVLSFSIFVLEFYFSLGKLETISL